MNLPELSGSHRAGTDTLVFSGSKQFREDFGRAILLGLEFLVAGDIIRTVVAPTMENTAVLGLLVLIRTFLSFSM